MFYRAARMAAAPDGLRACTSADLSVDSARTDPAAGGGGWFRTSFILKSVASSDCALPNGSLGVQLFDATGDVLPADAFAGGPAPTPAVLLIQPGQLIRACALWAVVDGRAARPARLVLSLGHAVDDAADGISVSVAEVAVPRRPRPPSNRGLWRSGSYGFIEQVADAGTLATLTATMAAPTTAALGSVVRYAMTLTNPSSTPVPLTPFPDFAQLLHVKVPGRTAAGGSRGTLNCSQAPNRIEPGESVTFAYELGTAGRIPGSGVLIWYLLDGTYAAAQAQAELTLTT